MKNMNKNLDAKINNGNKIYTDYANFKKKIENEVRFK